MALKVIGAGFGRTGTVSLKVALEQLGLGPCYHMSEVFANGPHLQQWIDAADGKPDWNTLLAGYQSTLDFPACSFWLELAKANPDAKVLLSVRDPASWFESTQETIMNPRFMDAISDTKFGELNAKAIWNHFDQNIHDRDNMIASFNRHTEKVKAAIPPERLLVYEVKQGWEPLCKFLGVLVPDAPFPRTNPREEFGPLIDMIIAGSLTPDNPNMPPGLQAALQSRKPG
ncbi:MAG: sulfotransferase family protein [Alphaproteobacteria bacterium]